MSAYTKSNIWKYYVFNFLTSFTVFLPFIVYYFQELGFSLGQIALLSGISAFTAFIFEIPSGYAADRIGRKNSLIIGTILQLAGVIILFTAQNYFILIVSHIFNGLAWAFFSGADSALLYDSLLFLKRETEYKRIDGKAKFCGELAIILSAVLGSLIIAFGVKQTILITLIGYTILVFVTFSFKEPKREMMRIHKLHLELAQLISIIKKSLINKKLLGLFCYSFVLLGVSGTIFVMYQPYFRATGLPLYYYGYVFAAFSIFAAIISLKTHYVEQKLGVCWSLVLMPVLIAGSLIGASLVFIWAGFVFFFLRETVRGYVFTVLGDYANRITNSRERATVLSIGGMFRKLGVLIISATVGFLSDSYGIKSVLLITGVILLVFAAIVFMFTRNNCPVCQAR